MIRIREEIARDVEARESLLDTCFGTDRFLKTCERLREGRLPADGLSLVVERSGALIGTVRLWHVSLGVNRPALMLGPLAVDPSCQGLGLGGRLMHEALSAAAAQGHEAVVLIGDAPYYGRFGFKAHSTAGLWLPGPFERARFLGRALREGALDGACGLVAATGLRDPAPDLAATAAQGKLQGLAHAA